MKPICVVILSTLLVSAAVSESYPFMMWSDNVFASAKEHSQEVTASEVLASVKSLADTSSVSNIVIVLAEGLTADKLIAYAPALETVKNSLLSHSVSYMKVSNAFDATQIDEAFGSSLKYTLENLNEKEMLAEQISQDLK